MHACNYWCIYHVRIRGCRDVVVAVGVVGVVGAVAAGAAGAGWSCWWCPLLSHWISVVSMCFASWGLLRAWEWTCHGFCCHLGPCTQTFTDPIAFCPFRTSLLGRILDTLLFFSGVLNIYPKTSAKLPCSAAGAVAVAVAVFVVAVVVVVVVASLLSSLLLVVVVVVVVRGHHIFRQIRSSSCIPLTDWLIRFNWYSSNLGKVINELSWVFSQFIATYLKWKIFLLRVGA